MLAEDPIELYRNTLLFNLWCSQVQKQVGVLPGVILGQSDGLMEEILLMEQYPFLKELETQMRTDAEIYFAARDRALARLVDGQEVVWEIGQAFFLGMKVALNQEPIAEELVEKVRTETNFGIGFVMGVQAVLEAKKGKAYLSSFQRRGEQDGILPNMHRKFDRIEAILEGDGAGNAESLTTNAADLGVYAGKWVTRRAETHPEEFLAWLEEVRGL